MWTLERQREGGGGRVYALNLIRSVTATLGNSRRCSLRSKRKGDEVRGGGGGGEERASEGRSLEKRAARGMGRNVTYSSIWTLERHRKVVVFPLVNWAVAQ